MLIVNALASRILVVHAALWHGPTIANMVGGYVPNASGGDQDRSSGAPVPCGTVNQPGGRSIDLTAAIPLDCRLW
jgi:hypothetical protein